MKSILQPERDRCFLCGRNGAVDPLDCHHVFFSGAYRKWSDKFGLTVYLCHDRCHETGERAVHRDAVVCRKLQRYAQKKAMRHYGWSVEQFRQMFGRNYLEGDES